MSTNTNFSGTPQDRWEAEQRAADAADPWRDHSRTLVRDSAGRYVQIARAPVADQRVDDATWARMTYPEKVAYAARMSGQK
jgi:hypothetical protein